MGRAYERKGMASSITPSAAVKAHSARNGGLPAVKGDWLAFRSAVVFLALLGLFYGFVHRPGNDHAFLTWHLEILTRCSAWVLQLMGYPAQADGTWLISDQFEALIARGCGAIEPLATYIAAVISIPIRPLWKKGAGLVVGSMILLAANLLRITSLAIVGIHWNWIYRQTHDQIFQAMFIILVFVIWVGWLQWATRSREAAHVDRQT